MPTRVALPQPIITNLIGSSQSLASDTIKSPEVAAEVHLFNLSPLRRETLASVLGGKPEKGKHRPASLKTGLYLYSGRPSPLSSAMSSSALTPNSALLTGNSITSSHSQPQNNPLPMTPEIPMTPDEARKTWQEQLDRLVAASGPEKQNKMPRSPDRRKYSRLNIFRDPVDTSAGIVTIPPAFQPSEQLHSQDQAENRQVTTPERASHVGDRHQPPSPSRRGQSDDKENIFYPQSPRRSPQRVDRPSLNIRTQSVPRNLIDTDETPTATTALTPGALLDSMNIPLDLISEYRFDGRRWTRINTSTSSTGTTEVSTGITPNARLVARRVVTRQYVTTETRWVKPEEETEMVSDAGPGPSTGRVGRGGRVKHQESGRGHAAKTPVKRRNDQADVVEE